MPLGFIDSHVSNLDLTEFTQPAIFLISYSIFEVIKNETKLESEEKREKVDNPKKELEKKELKTEKK